MRRNLCRYMNEKYPANPNSFAAVYDAFKNPNIFAEYGENMRKTEDFYIGTVVNEPMYSFTLFGSMEAIKMVEKFIQPEDRRYLLDGTFSIKPIGPYYQVLVIYIEVKNDVSIFVLV